MASPSNIRSADIFGAALIGAVAIGWTSPAAATPIPFPTGESSQYLLIGNGPVNERAGQPGVGQAVNINNFEIGANKAPVPSTSDFLTGDGGGGPGLRGNTGNIPLNARAVGTGITFDGNVAVTNPGGVFNFQDVGVYGNLGIRCAAGRSACDAGTQNSFFNDPNQFPNTFTPTGTQPGTRNVNGTGVFVGPGDAVQSTRIDKPNQAGVTGNVDFTGLRADLFGPTGAAGIIPGLARTGVLDLRGTSGKISSDYEFDLMPGLNIIDILTGGADFLLENKSNFVIDGSIELGRHFPRSRQLQVPRLQRQHPGGDQRHRPQQRDVLLGPGG